MAQLKNAVTGTEISRYVSIEKKQLLQRVVNRTTDGNYHIQIIGAPAINYNAVVYVDRTGLRLLAEAEYSADVLSAEVKHGSYYGRIIAMETGERLAGDRFEVLLTLAGENL